MHGSFSLRFAIQILGLHAIRRPCPRLPGRNTGKGQLKVSPSRVLPDVNIVLGRLGRVDYFYNPNATRSPPQELLSLGFTLGFKLSVLGLRVSV